MNELELVGGEVVSWIVDSSAEETQGYSSPLRLVIPGAPGRYWEANPLWPKNEHLFPLPRTFMLVPIEGEHGFSEEGLASFFAQTRSNARAYAASGKSLNGGSRLFGKPLNHP